jgi:hypothetical protein
MAINSFIEGNLAGRTMDNELDSAHAWFFDYLVHELSGTLNVRLTEGIRGSERQFVEVGETKLGPYFPVKVQAQSRCVQVTFPNVLAFFIYDESYDTEDPELHKGKGRFLFRAESSSFRKFSELSTSLAQVHQGTYEEFLLCCEDRIFHVLSADPPLVSVLAEAPNLNIERNQAWFAATFGNEID